MTKWCVIIREGLELYLVGLEWGKSNMMPEDVPFVFLLEMLEELYSEGSLEGQTKQNQGWYFDVLVWQRLKSLVDTKSKPTMKHVFGNFWWKVDENFGKYWTVE